MIESCLGNCSLISVHHCLTQTQYSTYWVAVTGNWGNETFPQTVKSLQAIVLGYIAQKSVCASLLPRSLQLLAVND